ncbi:transcription factor LHW [Ziziphus jujuba]|uniref:Transcription factor LHW n=2 Tax=Ziziphus jujuba TaxID=326968 RepID=A0ABM3I9V0_ZIZJJ|nr:transcription factor LHW [Ziziphus jujuba]XP_048324027.1 transcription factor LHW isoform X2 [Ziziphus jujuba var. spinosa]KAH7541816.1 hypothetical protein FEM48_Zijuj02G0007700 [Ziziphus jujuba var. spinosa]
MGFLLKEALKTLCGWNQWSYAVFWKIGCQNPKLLIWEECHYEPAKFSVPLRISGTVSDEVPFGELERCWVSSEIGSSQVGIHSVDRVFTLINKMLTSNQVNIVGEGMVGRAAFTGHHQWILSNNYSKDAHPPEVLNEMHHQFSAGMQTVAVIPVLPHGVVQLGSSSAIMENIAFVNEVKSLIMQLGCVRGALLSDSCATKDSAEKIGLPVTVGKLAHVDSPGVQKVTNSSSVVNNYNQQSYSSQASSLVGQPFHSLVKNIQHNQQTIGSTFENPANVILPKSHDNPCQPKFPSLMKSNFPCGGQLKDEIVGAEVVPSNLDAWLNRQVSSCNSRSGLNVPGFVQSRASQRDMMLRENKNLSGVSICNHLGDNAFVSNNFNMPLQRTSGRLTLDCKNGCGTTPLNERSQIHDGISRQSEKNLVPCSVSSPSTAFRMEEVSSSSLADQLATVHMLSKIVDHGRFREDVKLTQNGLAPSEQRIQSELFQAVNNSLVHPDESMPLSQHINGFVYDFENLDSKMQRPGSTNPKLEDGCIQPPSGDDLFDILGLDFKNNLLSCHLNNLLAQGLDGSAQSMGENLSTFTNMKDMDSTLCSASEGISDFGIFFGTGTDHLLDAVVSKAHRAAKQNSDDDDLSCRTTSTRISTASVPSSSLTYGCNSTSNHMQGEAFRLPEPMHNAGTVKSSSLKTGCSKDNVGNCSQTTSVYGSQISSWVEQGSSVKRENSVSTAYSKKPDELGKSNRKRLKPGENPKPRPKDRQMIQDRVKELREIVPNGAKCSIDALLERTIKHMLFLQSVTKHADKLKQTGESKIIDKEGGLLLKDNFEGGATWAFEVGSQSMVCPIVVEDLNPPRQMLVEMLCEERGFFLEIADLIRGMGLTILKGVMEARNDKIWARFAVEANRDVTRMEIFMSLVHLLEQTVKAGASSADAIGNNKLMVQHSFPQAAPIPATGRPSSLQ